ncbi:hypothetical protein ACH4OY_04730 [Micromonospora rubida]|uniref:Cytochrome c biogenesis protein ResB n=1 Tax=Micromonospora rubida TaxID=2697657 RepID=A0ABW7SH17_9ACTN
MSRSRLAVAAGIFLLVASCGLPCLPFLDLSAVSLPYQDPTPGMLEEQAEEIAAAEHRLAVYAVVAGVLAILGLAALIYAWKHRRSRMRDQLSKPGGSALPPAAADPADGRHLNQGRPHG